jgi:hypothetical protein
VDSTPAEGSAWTSGGELPVACLVIARVDNQRWIKAHVVKPPMYSTVATRRSPLDGRQSMRCARAPHGVRDDHRSGPPRGRADPADRGRVEVCGRSERPGERYARETEHERIGRPSPPASEAIVSQSRHGIRVPVENLL